MRWLNLFSNDNDIQRERFLELMRENSKLTFENHKLRYQKNKLLHEISNYFPGGIPSAEELLFEYEHLCKAAGYEDTDKGSQ